MYSQRPLLQIGLYQFSLVHETCQVYTTVKAECIAHSWHYVLNVLNVVTLNLKTLDLQM